MTKPTFIDPFDNADSTKPAFVDPFETDAATSKPEPKSGTIRRALGDTGVSLLKGAIGVPETVVGIADLVSGGQAGKLAESAGFKPKQAKEIISDYYSPEQKLANQKVQEADGFVNTIQAALQNPSTIVQTTAESLPVMGLGGVASRGLLSVAPKVAPFIAGAAGEGLVTAGQNAEQVRQENADGLLTGKQAAIQAGSGLLTGVISGASGKLANSALGQKLGLADIETMLATGKLTGQATKSLPKAIAGNIVTEGLLEEMPQSAQEQIAQNLSLDKPWDEGVGNAAAMGALSGGLMGGGAKVLDAFGGKDNTQVTPPPAPPAPEGSLTSAATIAQAVGLTPQPVMPDATEAKPNIVDSLNAVEAQQNGVMTDTAIAPIEPATIAPEQAAEKQRIDEIAHQAATSPLNDLPQPTDAQKEAGNYKKAHLKYDGLDITVENPQGSTRSGVDEDNKPWQNTLANHYGYIKRTKGNDGDNLDVFVGDKPASGKVFVINQTKKDGSFDEHKAVLGAETADEAIAIYKANYADDWNGGKSVTELTTPAFKDWLKNGDPTKPLETVSATNNDIDMTKVAVGDQIDVGGVPYVKTENGFERVTSATQNVADNTTDVLNKTTDVAAPAAKPNDSANILREIARLSNEVFNGNHPNNPDLSTADGTFAGLGSLNVDDKGNVILHRVARDENHLSKGWKSVKNGAQELIETSLSQAGGQGLPTSGLANWSENYNTNQDSERQVAQFTIPANELLDAIRRGDAIIGNVSEGEIVLNPSFAKQYLSQLNGKPITNEVNSATPANIEPAFISKDLGQGTQEALDYTQKNGEFSFQDQAQAQSYAERLQAGEGGTWQAQKVGNQWRAVRQDNVDGVNTMQQRVDETANGVQVPAIRKGKVGGMLAAQEVVTTSSGRTTTPFPKFNGKDGKVSNFGLKAVDKWLVDNAIAEAESRNDDFNLTQFKAINLKNLSQADKDGAEEYLFGSQPAVVPSILKPLASETAAPVNDSVQPTDTVRPLVEQLTKLRATADKHPSFDPALKAAKDFMAGKKVSPKQFKNFANLLGKKNKAFREVLMQLHDQAASTPEQLAAKEKKSKLAKAMLAERMKLDTTKDGLMQAMAKLGGLNADKAKSEFGIDPADMRQHGAGIKRSFNKNGLDADTMRELLLEQGYPVGDTVADLGNAIADAMSGIDVLTAAGQEALAQKKYEEYANGIDELSDDEQALLDELVTKATAKYGAEALAEIDASLAESMKGQPQVEIERALLRMLKEEFDDETGNAGTSQATEGQAGQDTETGSTETGSGRAQQDGADIEGQGSETSQVADNQQEDLKAKAKAIIEKVLDSKDFVYNSELNDALGALNLKVNPTSSKETIAGFGRENYAAQQEIENRLKDTPFGTWETLVSINEDYKSTKVFVSNGIGNVDSRLTIPKNEVLSLDDVQKVAIEDLAYLLRKEVESERSHRSNKQALADNNFFIGQNFKGFKSNSGKVFNATISSIDNNAIKLFGIIRGSSKRYELTLPPSELANALVKQGFIQPVQNSTEAPALELTGQTNEDINAGIAAQEAEARAQQEQAKADEAARIEAERKSRQEIAADSFDLTQTGKDAKSTKANDAKVIDNQFAGQGDLLSQPTEQPKSETKTAEKVAEVKDETPVTIFDNAMDSYSNGVAKVDDYKAAFNYVIENEKAITDYLNQNFTKQQLFERGGRRLESRYKSEKKDRVVSALYADMVSDFLLPGESGMTSYSYGYGEDKYKSIKSQIEAITQESLDQAMGKLQQAIQQHQEVQAERLQGMQDPKTLDDYTNYLRGKMSEGMSLKEARMTLTLDQRETYDNLYADRTIADRAGRKEAAQNSVSVAGQKVEGSIIETKHTQKGHDLFVVQLSERVSKEDYNTLNVGAKKLGGYYSSFRGRGAVPGFQFTTKENAEAFVQLAGGDNSAAKEQAKERRSSFEDDKSQTAVERLTEMADKLEEKADEELGRERKSNTSRRAGMAARAEANASAQKAMAITMRNIAQAIEAGSTKFLGKVRQKVQVELLQSLTSSAQYTKMREQYPDYGDYEKHQHDAPTKDTADYSEFPTYSLYRSDLANLGRSMVEIDGLKILGNRILSVADDVTDAYLKFAKDNIHKVSQYKTSDGKNAVFASKAMAEAAISRSGFKGKAIVLPFKRGQNMIIDSPSAAKERGIWDGDSDKKITLSADLGKDIVEKIGKANRRANKLNMPWQFENAYDKREKLARMGIETPAEMRAALREFIGLKEQAKQPDKIKELERKMIGRRNDGLDFFPTPASTADEMIEAADIQDGMNVLEPSAGMGHIAERIRDAGFEPDVVEFNGDRRELLELKGFNVVGSDFLDITEKYDRIIMNPPFSNRRDEEHIRHAYSLLKPNGKLVAIMGEGVFFGSDKRATDFREWLETVGGTSEKLEEGTFKDASLPVNTGVNARMVVIEKHGDSKDTTLYSRGFEFRNNQASLNANNKPIYSTKEGVANFWEWFNGFRDQVLERPAAGGENARGLRATTARPAGQPYGLDDQGRPKIFLHGTASDFSTFDFEHAQRKDHGWLGDGVYLTDDPLLAQSYSNLKAGNAAPNIMPVYAAIHNPFYATIQDKQKLQKYSKADIQAFTERLKAEGYDGVVLQFNDETSEVVALYPNQVKSALGNNGDFDAKNDDILYSRPQSRFSQKSTGIDIRDLNAVVANVNQALRGLPATYVLEDYTKAPAELVADIKRDKAYDAAGAWHNGEIYLFRNNIINTNHALFTMLHESTHEGLRRVFGKEIDATLMGIYLSNKDIKDQADSLRATHKDLSLVASVEEALADMGGNGIKASVMDKLVAFVRNFLRKLGMNLTVSDGEVRTLVTRALDSLKSPSKVTHYTIGSAYSAASSGDQTNTPEFKAWFGDSKVVDADGNPLVVYHGTGSDFSSFDTKTIGNNFRESQGGGFFFAEKKQSASNYAELSGGESKNVIPVYLKANNPMVVEVDSDGVSPADYYDMQNSWLPNEAKLSGNDSIIIKGTKGDSLFVVFEPTQIKSAIGNNGDFDPNNPDIRYSRPTPRLSPVVQPITPNQQWQSPDKSKLDNVIYMLQNKFVDLKRVTQAIQKSGNTIEDKWNPYLLEENFTGRTAKRTKDFLKQELEPLMKSMQARKVEMADFEEYLWARHAEERNIQIAKINPAMQDGGSGMKTQDARDYLANLTPVQSANYQALAAKVDAILKTSRQRLISYGLETPETIAAWEGAYQHYVPLMREDMDNGFGNGTGQGFSVKGNASKRATGSKRAVVDILANIAQQVERNIIRGEKNRVSTALVGLATLNPNKDFWKVDVVPKMRTVVAGKNTYEVLYNGSVVQNFTNPVEANKFIQWNGAGYTLNIVKGQDLVMDVPDPSYKNRDNIVVARIVNAKGKIEEHFVEFNTHDERAMRAAASIKNLDQDQIGELLGTASSITRYFSSINTQYNPFFGVINILRDVQGSLLNLSSTALAGKQLDVLKNTPLALKGIYQDIRSERKTGTPTNSYWSLLFEDFQKQGGQTGYRDMYRNAKERGEALKHALDPTWWQQTTAGKIVTINGILAKPEQFLKEAGQKYIFDWLSDYNESMENAVRLSAYKVALDNGMSKAQAASLAKNISVNFNRKGEMGRQIGSLYAFFNASVQGTARIGETLFTDDNGKMTLSNAGKAIVTGGLLLGVMQALMLAAAGFGDDEPPEFVRDRNLIIPLGNGKAITIAMPLGFNALPAFGRILTEWALSGGEDTSKRFFHIFEMLAEVTNPIGNAGLSMQTITPTMFDPLAALAENKDWTGRPIAKMDFNSQKPTAGHTRAKDTASAISKGLSWVINEATGGSDYTPGALSPTPDQIDYLIGQLTGGVGREYMKLEQSATSIVTGEDLPVYKIPLVGRFYLDAEGQSSQSSRFYDNLKSVFETETELKGLRKDGLDTSEYRASHPEAALVFRANLEQREISQLYKIRSEKLKADASPDEIKALNERITARMLKFNELFKTRTTAGE